MNRPIAYGIDFGTTNSSIAIAYSDRVDMVDLSREGPAALLPSIIYLHRNRNRAAGHGAVRQYQVTGAHTTSCADCEFAAPAHGTGQCWQYKRGGSCHDARIMSELKVFLADPEFTRTHSWGVDFEMPDLVSIVLAELKRAADRKCDQQVTRAVIGFPVMFPGAEGPAYEERQQLAIDRLLGAAKLAGFEEVYLLEEPAAATVSEQSAEGLVVVVDFGGGTFDVAVVELGEEQGEVLALQGAEIGGERFTKALFDAKVAPWLGLDDVAPTVPAWFKRQIRGLSGVMRLLSSRDAPAIFRSHGPHEGLAILHKIFYGGHAYDFYRAIEQAKIDLSTKTRTQITFRRPGIKEVAIPVERSEFDSLIRADLDIVEGQLLAALAQAGIEPEDVTAVLRTGGSSSIPAFVHRLEAIFGSSKIQEREAFTTVVYGLASYARTLWAA